MTREQAIEAAQQFGTDIYLNESVSNVDGVQRYTYFSLHIDNLFKVSCGKSWQDCIDQIIAMNPVNVRREKAEELRKELATLEGEAA